MSTVNESLADPLLEMAAQVNALYNGSFTIGELRAQALSNPDIAKQRLSEVQTYFEDHFIASSKYEKIPDNIRLNYIMLAIGEMSLVANTLSNMVLQMIRPNSQVEHSGDCAAGLKRAMMYIMGYRVKTYHNPVDK
jgi:hypothetical protein